MIDRRRLASWAALSLGLPAAMAAPCTARAADGGAAAVRRELQAIERASGARLGVHFLDTASGASVSHRADERFLMCSTAKLLMCAEVLRRVDRGQEKLQRRVVFEAGVLMAHSPVTEARVGGAGMTLAELCEAAMTVSDNAAANLVLDSCGGPPRVTALARSLGDAVTRLDDREPELNRPHAKGDPRNTSAPRAMLGSLHALLLGPALSAASREQLLQWMLANQTGDKLLRAKLPKDWRIGDKTGGGEGTRNDIAIVWPPGRPPWLATVFLTDSRATPEARDATLAQVGAVLARLMA